MFIISAYYLSILIIFTSQNFGGVHLNDTDFQMDSQELYLKFHIFCKVQLFFEYLIFQEFPFSQPLKVIYNCYTNLQGHLYQLCPIFHMCQHQDYLFFYIFFKSLNDLLLLSFEFYQHFRNYLKILILHFYQKILINLLFYYFLIMIIYFQICFFNYLIFHFKDLIYALRN